ncbi:MAG: alpha/beta fold hydrolase [Candidatus Lernaella stagnicola]|nr:alpha/beta fold hydrolase [Candidatus Lernaella stagnicola]
MKSFLRLTLVLLVAALLCLAACQADDDDDDAGGNDNNPGDDDGAPGSFGDDDVPSLEELIDGVEVEWFPCSLYEGLDDGRAECAATQMPMHWLEPDDRTFTVYAKRLPAEGKAATAQLWLLHGGPGASGVIEFPVWMEYFHDYHPDFDIYTLDPRGSGFSEYLECPLQESKYGPAGISFTLEEAIACGAYLEENFGDDLIVYGTTHSAIDVGAYIHHTREENQKVFVWGGSGGVFWGHRYLQYFPDQADGMIFEGIVPAESSIAFQDEYADKAVRAIFDLCAADEFCDEHLPDPEPTLYALYDKLDAGHCATLGMTTEYLKVFFDQLAYYWPWYATIPAIIYRVDRCSPEDINAVALFFNQVFGSGKTTDDLDKLSLSEALFYHEMSSELWEHSRFPTDEDLVTYLDGVYETSLVGYGKGYDRHEIYLSWPVYDDPVDDQWATTDVPMLMMNGVLDPSTPNDFALEMGEHFNGPHQHFYSFAYGAHGVSGASPYLDGEDIADCGYKLWSDFMDDPTAELDDACVAQNLPPNFEGTDYALYFFGTENYWEGGPAITTSGANPAKSWPDHMLEQQRRQINDRVRRDAPDIGFYAEVLARDALR